MIRLDPSAPPLWRHDGTVQFGSPAQAHLAHRHRWTDPALAALESGTSRAALRALIRVHGGRDRDADDLPAAAVRAVLAALPARTPRVDWAGSATHPAPPGSRVLLLAAHRVDPRRAVDLMRHDVVHLPLVLDGSAATVGPVIAPGATACLSCLDATRRQDDPSWPLVAAQLLARPRPAIDVTLAAEAARAARHLLSGRIDPVTRSLHLRVDSLQRAWRTHRPSADCRCRSLEGTATVSAPIVLARATSSPTAFARPA